MPIPGERLVLEPRHPAAKIYDDQAQKDIDDFYPDKEEKIPDDFKIINRWHNKKHGIDIFVYFANGKRQWGYAPAVHHFDMDLSTMGCAYAWSIESEANAQKLLGTLLPHHLFKMYLLTGMFPQTSQRSGVTYFFRRLRPTVAIRASDTGSKILAALCMHPIGYYAGSWAGGLCPTDDVIAHLLLMRSDEPMYWRRCNQHPAYHPLAGL